MPGEKTFSFEEVLTGADMTTYFVQQAMVIKAADESVVSSTVLQDDNELQITVSANTKYFVECFLIYSADPAADCKIQYAVPAGATFDWVSDSLGSAATANTDVVSRSYQTTGTPALGGVTSNATNLVGLHKGLLTVTTAGIFKLTWAQLASTVNATFVRANSALILTRMT